MTYRIYDDLLIDPEARWDKPHEPFFEWRPPFQNVDPEGFPLRWCIVGGGVAGLTAAYELTQFAVEHNLPVQIDLFERSARLGGRIRTHNFSVRSFAEMGPMRIPTGHKVALHYIEDVFGLRLHVFSGEANFFYRGKLRNSWHEIYKEAAATTDPNHSTLTKMFASRMTNAESVPLDPETLIVNAMNNLQDADVRNFLFAARHVGERASPRYRILDLYRNVPATAWGIGLDAITVREAFDIAVHQWVGASELSAPDKRTFAQHLWDEVATLQGLNWLEQISCFHFLREGQALAAPHKRQLVGGFQGITGAFERNLGSFPNIVTLATNSRVRAITWTESGVDVVIAGRGAPGAEEALETRSYDRVICAVPIAAVCDIAFEPALSPKQRTALNGVSYLPASKSAVHFKRRWWELGEEAISGFPRKVGGVTYTDLPNQQIWYPNDNVPSEPERLSRDGEDVDEFEAVERASIAPPPAHERLEDQDISMPVSGPAARQKSEGEGALLAAYMWGKNAARFGSLDPGDRDTEIIRCLEAVAPGCAQDIVDVEHVPWTLERNPAGGAFAWYEPAQHTRYQSVAGAPLWPVATGGPYRVTFAGEHLALIQGWLQGAMQSALCALRDSTE